MEIELGPAKFVPAAAVRRQAQANTKGRAIILNEELNNIRGQIHSIFVPYSSISKIAKLRPKTRIRYPSILKINKSRIIQTHI